MRRKCRFLGRNKVGKDPSIRNKRTLVQGFVIDDRDIGLPVARQQDSCDHLSMEQAMKVN